MLKNKTVKKSSAKPPKCASKLITMQQAMEYLNDSGVPCKNRATFYRILKDFAVPYVNLNPQGKNEMRRFKQTDLDKVLQATTGLE